MRFPSLRVLIIILLASLVAGWPTFVFGQDATKAHVAVVQFSNETDSDAYDAACSAATETLVLTLRELGRYIVEPEQALPSGSGDEGLRSVAEECNLDFILYGRMSTPESGGILCNLSVYDRAKGKTTLSRSEKATGVLDIFNTADRLVVSVLESMTGGHIGFGMVALENAGEQGSYAVLLDGSPIGRDLESLDKVPSGRHVVTVMQKRMLGDREIASSSVDVKEGETTALSFAVPYLMDDEKQKVDGLRAAIETGWNDATAVGDIDTKIAEFASLFDDVTYSPKLSAYKDEATRLGGEWALQKKRLAVAAAKAQVNGGRIVLPWIPSGAKVRLGQESPLVLANEATSGFRSSVLSPGDYAISVGDIYNGRVTVVPGGEAEPADYRSAMAASLGAKLDGLDNRLAVKRKKTTAGWISLATGFIGGGGAAAAYYLGKQAMATYNAQTTTTGAASAWNTVSLYGTLFTVAVAVGGIGLGLSPLLLVTGPDPKALQRSIDDLDEGIRALGKQ